MEKYKLEDLRIKTVEVDANGQWSDDIFQENKHWDINDSGIITLLIQKAGTICKHYASDLFITVSSMKKEIEKGGRDYPGGKYIFGFRESGVDHDAYVLNRLNNYGLETTKKTIKEIYVLDITVEEKWMEMCLGKADMEHLEAIDKCAAYA